ncbi:hypothetical protein GCM10023183_34750 [Nibribacter koreensis]|uniref:MORN repeat variant n=2 Tax=Nibribacter koreensis TaxID=1084519 RepID=A0ABP8G0G6_9BACT
MFSNKYVFYENGTFKHYYSTDDGQLWYGVGKYFDKGRERTLKFGEADTNFKLEYGLVHYETGIERIMIKKRRTFISTDYHNTTTKEKVTFVEKK